MRVWARLALGSVATSVLTLGAAAFLGLILLVALNGFSEADGAPAIVAFFLATVGGNAVVVSIVNRAILRKTCPHADAGLGMSVAIAGLVTSLFALVPAVILAIHAFGPRRGGTPHIMTGSRHMADAFGVAMMLYVTLVLVWAVVLAVIVGIIRLVPGPRWRHADPAVRRDAIETLTDRVALAYVARSEGDAGLRRAAQARLESLAGLR